MTLQKVGPMKRVEIHPSMPEDPKRRGGDVLIMQPDEDLITDDGADFTEGETLGVYVPSPDGAIWDTTGEVLEIDRDDTPTLVMVRLDWGQATLAS